MSQNLQVRQTDGDTQISQITEANLIGRKGFDAEETVKKTDLTDVTEKNKAVIQHNNCSQKNNLFSN